MTDTLCKEISLRKDYMDNKTIHSVYVGGGTPSLLSLPQLEQLFETLNENYPLNNDAEITFEVNPEDAGKTYLQHIKTLGVNRLSMGLQSFNNEELRWMNRAHTAEQNIRAVREAQSVGFDNISIDLIYGSKFQTEESWRSDLRTAFGMGTQHISSYNLTVEDRTQLHRLIMQKKEAEVESEKSAALFDILMEETAAAGFEQYEISNFCRPGFMAVHNSNYWKNENYLGIGPSAHSYNGGGRRYNVKSNAAYIKGIQEGAVYFEEEILSPNDLYNEYVLTRLRTAWGCDTAEMESRFGKKYSDYFTEGIKKHARHLIINKNKVTLNKAGKHFADGIASDLFYTA